MNRNNNKEKQVNLGQNIQAERKASVMTKNNFHSYAVSTFILFVALFFTACQTTSVPIPQVSSVAITAPTSTTLKVAETLTLAATVTGTPNPSQLVNWESDKPNIASINSSGQVTAIAAGSVIIKAASLADTTKFATITLTIEEGPTVSSVVIGAPKTTLTVSETLALSAAVVGSNDPSQQVAWESDAATVATVSSTGVVTALTKGTVTIKATSVQDTTKSATVVLTIEETAPVGDFSLDLPNGDTSIEINSTQTVTVTVSPTGGFTGDVVLTVSDIPEGITATLSPTTITGGTGSSTLTITVDASYNGLSSPRLKVTGTSGTLSDSGFVSLNILPEE